MKNVYLLEIDTLRVRMPKANAKGKLELSDEFEPMDKLEVVGVFASVAEAHANIPAEAKEALITALPIGVPFLRGIGEAAHEHVGGTTY